MNIEFVINDYLIAWYLLFKPSFNEEIQILKEKLWINYQKQYIAMQKENLEILKYTKDFIPDDDTLYNLIFDTEIFDSLKKQLERYKQQLLEVWDKNRKVIDKEFREITRIKNINSYTILLVNNEFDVVEFIKSNPKKNIVFGKKYENNDNLRTIIDIINVAVKYEMGDFQKENREITTSILELAIINELHTRITSNTKYLEGDKKLKLLRKQLYPYWLMYLGCDKEDLLTYMMRDQIAFDIDKYTIERGLRTIDLYSFIDFCCKNQKYLIRLDNLEL